MSEAVAISKALTSQQILARLLTVDGAGSGVDADYLRGVTAENFTPGLNIGGTPISGAIFPRARPMGLGAIRFSTLR